MLRSAWRPLKNICKCKGPLRKIHTSFAVFQSERYAGERFAEDELQRYLQKLQSDAHSRILASPLRRCSVTQTVLPRLLMFRMLSLRDTSSIEADEAEIDSMTFEENVKKKKKNPKREPILRRRSRRWLLKEKKKSKLKSLISAQRMAQHKFITSQTEESKNRFQKQIDIIKGHIEILKRSTSRGQLLPFGLSRESERRSIGMARGKGMWFTLNKNIVAAAFNRKALRSSKHIHSSPIIVSRLLQEGLEGRVVEEAQLLLQHLTGQSYDKSLEKRWLIRRLRGEEVRVIVGEGFVRLKNDEEAPLACLLFSSGSATTIRETIPVYELDTIILDTFRRDTFKEAIRNIAILLHKKQRRSLRRTSQVSTSSISESTSEIQKQKALIPLLNVGEKQPRVHAIKRDPTTVNLCIALWRLHAWSHSN